MSTATKFSLANGNTVLNEGADPARSAYMQCGKSEGEITLYRPRSMSEWTGFPLHGGCAQQWLEEYKKYDQALWAWHQRTDRSERPPPSVQRGFKRTNKITTLDTISGRDAGAQRTAAVILSASPVTSAATDTLSMGSRTRAKASTAARRTRRRSPRSGRP